MWKEILLTVFYWGLFNFLILRFRKLQFSQYKTWVTHLLFNAKFAAGIFIWLVYTFYYRDVPNNDVHKFYNNAVALKQIADEHPSAFAEIMFTGSTAQTVNIDGLKNWNRSFDESPFNANRVIIRLNVLLLFVSCNTYLVHVLFFCFISLIGWIFLVNAVFESVDKKSLILALPALLLPSVLFWNSGVMKEPLMVLGIGLLVSGIIGFKKQIGLKEIVKIAFGAIILLFSKFFVLMCIVPAAVAFLLRSNEERKGFVLAKYGLVYGVMLIVALNIHQMIPSLNFQEILMNKYTHAIKEAAYFNAGSKIEIPVLENNFLSILKASFAGVWNIFARPFPWECNNVMQYFCMIENVVQLSFVLTILSFINLKKLNHLNLFIFLLSFSLSYFALTGMCTPVVGNLVRYKAPLLPVFLFAFAIIINPKFIAESLSFVLRE